MSMTEEEFWKILLDVPEPKPIFYRLYYNDDGTPIVYTMEDLPGKYIEIDQPTYARSAVNVKVINGKIVEVVPRQYVQKLTPSDQGTPCHPTNVCVVVNTTDSHIKWRKTTNESN